MNDILNWLLGGRDVNAPVEEGVPDWVSGDPMGTSAQAKRKRDYLAQKLKQDQAQKAIDELRAKAEGTGNRDQMVGGGGGSPGIGSLPQILVPGNNWGTALAQGAQGMAAGSRQRELDAQRTAWEEEQRRLMDEAARQFNPGGAQANPTQGAAPASALPLATRGTTPPVGAGVAGSSAILTDKTPEQLAAEDARLSESMQNIDAAGGMLPPATNTGMPPAEEILLNQSDFGPGPQASNGILQGALPAGGPQTPSSVLPQATAGMTLPAGDPRFMAAYQMASLPLGAEIGKEMMQQVTGGGNDPTAQMKNLAFYNSLPDEMKPMFMQMVRDQNLDLKSGFLDQSSGRYIPKGFDPAAWVEVENKARAANSTEAAHSAFLQEANGDPELAYQLKEMAIKRQAILDRAGATGQVPGAPRVLSRALGGMASSSPGAVSPSPSGGVPPIGTALPQAIGNIANEADVRGAMNLGEMATDPSFQPTQEDILQQQIADAKAAGSVLPQTPSAPAPAAPAPGKGRLAGPGQVQAEKTLATERAKNQATEEFDQATMVKYRPVVGVALDDLKESFDFLKKNGGIGSTKADAVRNMWAYVQQTGIGQKAGKALATENQSRYNDIDATKSSLLSVIMKASGLGSKQLDSNVELQNFKKQLSDAGYDYEANMKILRRMAERFAPDKVELFGGVAPAADAGAAGGVDPEFEAWKKSKGL